MVPIWTHTADGTVHVVKSFAVSSVGGKVTTTVTYFCDDVVAGQALLIEARSYRSIRYDDHRCAGCMPGIDLVLSGF